MTYQSIFNDSEIVVIREAVLDITLQDLGHLWFTRELDVSAVDSIMIFSRMLTDPQTRESPEALHTMLGRFLELQRETLTGIESMGHAFPARVRNDLLTTINKVQIALAQIQKSQIDD
jgi:hypothetical protein